MLGTDLSGLNPPSLLPHAPPTLSEDTFRSSMLRTIHLAKHHRPLLCPKTFFGSILSHDIAFGSLASSKRGAAGGRWRSALIGFHAVLRGAFMDIFMVVFVSGWYFSTACPRIVTLTALQTAGRRVSLCSRLLYCSY